MKQVRKGKYTKQQSRVTRLKAWAKRRYVWFKGLSKPKKALVIATPFLAFLIITPIATYLYYAHDISDQERLMNRNNTGVVLLDRNDKVFYSVGRAEHRNLVSLDAISDDMENALIASEDKNFYEHGGFSIAGYARAFVTGVGGGSTLTQQLAKNTLLSDKHSYFRKYQELFVAMAIEQQYSKDEILDMYLNSVFYGENTFGIEEAAKTYFNTTPDKLTLAQSAMLVGLLPAPSVYSPISGDPELATKRQSIVLGLMVEQGYITEAEKTAAQNEKLTYATSSGIDSTAPFFVEMVISELSDKYGYEEVMRSGYRVTTTLDLDLQETLNKSVAAQVPSLKANGGSNASAVAIDPKTGGVRALVGSVDYNNKTWGKVNMATTARQPASTFKTLYYAGALADGVITPATVLEDKPINIGGWQPQNADRKFRGDVTVRSAINQSLNIPSIEVMQKYGVDQSIQTAKNLGVTALDETRDYGLPLAIGSGEVPLLQMTTAYATLADGGMRHDTSIISSVEDKFGAKVFSATHTQERGISQAGAFLISDILSDNQARSVMFGSSLNIDGHTVAVKTGTTDDQRDALTIGYTPSLAIGVWAGNNNNEAMYAGGYAQAGPIWRSAMTAALAGTQDEPFQRPDTVVERATCYSNHGIATNDISDGTYKEMYLASALPTTTCTPEEPKIKVCETATGKVVEIKESDYEGNKYSRDTKNCEPPQVEEDTAIEVCELATGNVITIDQGDFDATLHSNDTASCAPPDSGTTESGTTDSGTTPIPTP